MASRESAYAQMQAYSESQGVSFSESEFQSAWNNASRDSGAYQSGPNGTPFTGSVYDKTWEDIWPSVKARIDERAGSTNYRQTDSQSPEGDLLYGSGTGNPQNLPGLGGTVGYEPPPVDPRRIVSAAVPLTPVGPVTVLASDVPAVGPVGLAYPSDPVNYATMQTAARYGYTPTAYEPRSGSYSSGYTLPSAGMASESPSSGLFGGGMSTWLILGALGIGAIFLIKKP